MICTSCRAAAEEKQLGNSAGAEQMHQECPGGTWCDCQHDLSETVIQQQFLPKPENSVTLEG